MIPDHSFGTDTKTSVAVKLVTPEEASYLLVKNVRNRPLSEATVQRYTRLMKDGRWLLNCDAIGIDTNGELVNGQHRLKAVVRSRTPVPMIIALGLSPEVFEVSDVGKKRSGSEVLASHGYHNYATLAAVATLAYSFHERQNLDGNTTMLENNELLEFVKTYPGLMGAAQIGQNIAARSGLSSFLQTRLVGFAYALYGGKYPKAEAWLNTISTGEGVVKRDPLGLVRNRFLKDATEASKLPFGERLALLVTALNLKAQNKERGILKWFPTEQNPFPQVFGVTAEEIFGFLEREE